MADPVLRRARSSSTWPEQDQRDDDRGGLEVDRDDAVGVAEPGREQLRRDGGDGAVAPRGRGAEARSA